MTNTRITLTAKHPNGHTMSFEYTYKESGSVAAREAAIDMTAAMAAGLQMRGYPASLKLLETTEKDLM